LLRISATVLAGTNAAVIKRNELAEEAGRALERATEAQECQHTRLPPEAED
jgi:hypothetical protein